MQALSQLSYIPTIRFSGRRAGDLPDSIGTLSQLSYIPTIRLIRELTRRELPDFIGTLSQLSYIPNRSD